MASVTTSSGFRTYIKQRLGWPLINIELHNDHMDMIADDAVETFNRYNYGNAAYFDYYTLSVTSGVDEYSLSGNNIQDIYDFQFSMGADGINTLFSPTHDLLYDAWVVKGGYPGGPGGSIAGQGMVLSDYDIGMMYLEEIKRRFGREYRVLWNSNREVLKLIPTPNKDITGVLLLYKKETLANLYNNILFRDLCVAKARKLWGEILGKFTVTLPGGGTFNGADIKTQGIEEEKAAMERVIGESEPIDFYVA